MPSNRTVLYVDFGYVSAREFWQEVGLPAINRFLLEGNRGNAIEASSQAWHIHEWVWHESHPGEDTRYNTDYRTFQNDLIVRCPELAWVRDIADAGKHRGLGRPAALRRVDKTSSILLGRDGSMLLGRDGEVLLSRPELTIEMSDGSIHAVAVALRAVAAFWDKWFEKTA
jgi:hypothetical protein